MLENETAEGWGFGGWGSRFWRRLLSSCARYYKLKISLGGWLQVLETMVELFMIRGINEI